jgi:ATP-dependent DNA helicase RecQ
MAQSPDPLYGPSLKFLRTALNNPAAEFRDGQWEAITYLIRKKVRLLVVQKTGWGKSLIYFLATKLLRDQGHGPTLLISPLLALMRNQIEAAKRIGVIARSINSTNPEAWESVKQEMKAGKVDVLLVSPERLANDEFREDLLLPVAQDVGLFVVDEAHCISDWGHDFRPDYRRITRVIQALPANVPVLATTATANNRVVNDVVAQLGPGLQVMRGSLVRESLQLQNIELPSPAARMAWLADTLPHLPGNGIVYVLTVKDSIRLASWLKTRNIDAEAYYGGLKNEIRETLEDRLLSNRIKALVATSALGMGFDKPDLGFVIHYQRPGSVVHYYQQVGRAGRMMASAYGIMLSGDEDEEITDYFINTAFPPRAHTQKILDLLEEADDGMSLTMLEQLVNLTRTQIEKALKILATETPAPVVKSGYRWYATGIDYRPDTRKIELLTGIRKDEQARMREYLASRQCLMSFLRRELDDPADTDCGRCAPCRGKDIVSKDYSFETAEEAVKYLRHNDQVIEPRKEWPVGAMRVYGWSHLKKIDPALRMEAGRSLCLWGDAGWGDLVRKGKQVLGRFDNRLVDAVAEMIDKRWKPQPYPGWVACVPSLTRPNLVPDFARRLAAALRLQFVDCIKKTRATQPQKEMNNSFQQARNLDGAFAVNGILIKPGSVLLVDDMVDSRWTFTVLAALLRQEGAGPVFPVALAMSTSSQ